MTSSRDVRHPVHDVLELLQPVGDVHDAAALGFQLPNDAEQVVDLPGGEGGGGFVHDQHLGVVGQGLGNLHHLLLGHGQLAHHLPGVQVDFQLVQDAFGFGLHAGVVQLEALALFPAQEHVFRHGQVPAHVQLLVDDGHAHLLGQLGVQVPVPLPEDFQLPRVPLVDAAEHLHQGALARAVLPQQGHDLAGAQREVHMVQGLDAGEALAYPLHGYNGFIHFSNHRLPFIYGSMNFCPLTDRFFIGNDSLSKIPAYSKGGVF